MGTVKIAVILKTIGLKRILKLLERLSFLLVRDSWNSLEPADILMVRHDNNCGQLIDGKSYSTLLDSIADEIPSLVVRTVAKPYSVEVGGQSYANAVSFNGSFAREALIMRLLVILGIDQSSNRLPHLATWRKIISRILPKCVISIQPCAALCQACHDFGVRIFDVQHGYIGPSNPTYNEKLQLGCSRSCMPDCILCWDNESADYLRFLADAKGIEIRVIGNTWINKFIASREGDQIIHHFGKEIAPSHLDAKKTKILVTLQWGLDDPLLTPNQELFTNEFIPAALEAAVLETMEQYEWVFRPHPVQYKNEATMMRLTNYVVMVFGSGVQISTGLPLPYVLSLADLHVTYNSSVIIEAEYFHIKSALLDPQIIDGLWAGYFSHQIARGAAEFVRCKVDAIVDWIHTSASCDRQARSMTSSLEYRRFLDEMHTAGEGISGGGMINAPLIV